jgi:hypothetical protein
VRLKYPDVSQPSLKTDSDESVKKEQQRQFLLYCSAALIKKHKNSLALSICIILKYSVFMFQNHDRNRIAIRRRIYLNDPAI